MDTKLGILSLAAFHTPENFAVPPQPYRTEFGLDLGGYHAVDIIGVDLDASGKIRKLKIRNSWGAASGDHGDYHMYMDYFKAYASYLFFRQK
jgi:aminopeptidase C